MINGIVRKTAKTTRGFHNWHWSNIVLWMGAYGWRNDKYVFTYG